MDYWENMGFSDVITEENINGFIGAVVQTGEPIIGYYGSPYINRHFGRAQFIARTVLNPETDGLEVVGMDVHGRGACEWDVVYSGMNLKRDGDDQMQFRGTFASAESEEGILPIEIVNADVLPGILEGDRVKLQMIAYALGVDYYETVEAFSDAMPEDEMGQKWLLERGTIFPNGILKNHQVKDKSDDTAGNPNQKSDMYVTICAVVKGAYWGMLEFGEEEYQGYIRTIVETKYGDLEIVHTPEQISEESRKNLKEGSIVYGLICLSGDPAIYDYEQGIIKDEEHNLQLLRYTIEEGKAERLRPVLKEDSVYITESPDKQFSGRKDIVERFQYVKETSSHTFHAYKATITEVEPGLEYPVGKRCLVLSMDEPDNLESIMFVDLDEEGNISRIYVSRDTGYRFSLDRPLKSEEKDIVLERPKEYINSMIARAGLYGFVEIGTNKDDVLTGEVIEKVDTDAFYQLLDQWPRNVPFLDDESMRSVFGYMFAKAIEEEYTRCLTQKGETPEKVIYNAFDVWGNTYSTKFDGEELRRLKLAKDKGESLYTDFSFSNEDLVEEEKLDELEKAILWVCCIGTYCAEDYMTKEWGRRKKKQEEKEED